MPAGSTPNPETTAGNGHAGAPAATAQSQAVQHASGQETQVWLLCWFRGCPGSGGLRQPALPAAGTRQVAPPCAHPSQSPVAAGLRTSEWPPRFLQSPLLESVTPLCRLPACRATLLISVGLRPICLRGKISRCVTGLGRSPCVCTFSLLLADELAHLLQGHTPPVCKPRRWVYNSRPACVNLYSACE